MPSHARPAGTLVRLEPSAHAHFWYTLSQNRASWDLEQADSTWGLSFLCSCWKGCVSDRMRQKDGGYSGVIARRVVCLLPAPSWAPRRQHPDQGAAGRERQAWPTRQVYVPWFGATPAV